jgi:hypothetical protein
MRRHAQLRKVQGAIAKWFEDGAVKPRQNYLDGIGKAAGLVCIRYKGKDGDVPEFAINTAMLQGYDEIERDIAIEVGDWKEKREISVPPEPPSEKVLALAKLPPDVSEGHQSPFRDPDPNRNTAGPPK